jgi:hypothetical protein
MSQLSTHPSPNSTHQACHSLANAKLYHHQPPHWAQQHPHLNHDTPAQPHLPLHRARSLRGRIWGAGYTASLVMQSRPNVTVAPYFLLVPWNLGIVKSIEHVPSAMRPRSITSRSAHVRVWESAAADLPANVPACQVAVELLQKHSHHIPPHASPPKHIAVTRPSCSGPSGPCGSQ